MDAQRSMVLHFPGPVELDPKVGSTAQVARMLDGFRSIGFDVHVVAGSSRERRDAMRRIIDLADGGQRFELVYSKASTIPTPLTDPRHVPLRPLLDARFFRAMRGRGTRVALFYPDVHWRFPETWQPTRARRAAYGALYRFDLAWYRSSIDLIFLPSLAMARWIPGWTESTRVRELNPGGHIDECDVTGASAERLRLFYVGGVGTALYDISPLVDAVCAVDGVELTICCPPGTGDQYRKLSPRITVVHGSGDVVRDGYRSASISTLVYTPLDYRTFAMPIKLFESMGAGKPVLATAGSAAAEFIERTGTGWAVDNDQMAATLARLAADRTAVSLAQAAVLSQRVDHTWAKRAQSVADELAALGPTSPDDGGGRWWRRQSG